MSTTSMIGRAGATPHAGRVRFTVPEFEAMLDAGLFAGRHVELLDGEVYEATKNPPHDLAVLALADAFKAAVPSSYHVREEKAIASWGRWRPEPDIAVARGTFRDYPRKSPEPRDLVLVVEVTDTSVQDRTRKRTGYAKAGIPAYWILDLNARHLEVYTLPPGAIRYAEPVIVPAGDSVELVLDGTAVGRIAVASLLPE